MKSLAFALLCVACTSDPGTDFPVEPGTNGSAATSGNEEVDTGGTMLRGRVCVRESLFMTTCLRVGADNLTVQLGNRTATTSADGSFALTAPAGTGLSFNVSGPGIVTTSQALNARARINVLRQNAFDQMLTVNGLALTPGTGSVIAQLTDANGIPVSGVTAASTPVSPSGPFFDGIDPMPWVTNATGASGIVWFPGLVAGPAELSFNTLTGGSAIVGGVQVINGGITMVETPLP